MNKPFNFRVATGALVLALGVFAHAAPVTTVGTYAPNPNAISILDAASNSLPTGLSLSSFRTLVSSAYSANLGGVIDFEVGNGFSATPGTPIASVDATYGTSQATTLTFARTDSTGGVPNTFNSNNNNASVVSGSSYLGMNAVNGTFTFSKGLSAFGLTMLPRLQPRHATLTLLLDNASTITTSQELTDSSNAVFFGVAAPTGRTIIGATFAEPDGFTRYDDLGFVVAAPVPEPSTIAVFALGGLAVLRKRRK